MIRLLRNQIPVNVESDSPIGGLFAANVTLRRAELTNHLGEVTVYERPEPKDDSA